MPPPQPAQARCHRGGNGEDRGGDCRAGEISHAERQPAHSHYAYPLGLEVGVVTREEHIAGTAAQRVEGPLDPDVDHLLISAPSKSDRAIVHRHQGSTPNEGSSPPASSSMWQRRAVSSSPSVGSSSSRHAVIWRAGELASGLRRRRPPLRQRQHVGSGPEGLELYDNDRRDRGPIRSRSFGGRAGGDRIGDAAQRPDDSGGVGRAATAGLSHRDRRLRHRLLVARLPHAVPHRHLEDRQELRRRARGRQPRGGAHDDHRRDRPGAPARDDRRRHRAPHPGRAHLRRRLRKRAGVPLLETCSRCAARRPSRREQLPGGQSDPRAPEVTVPKRRTRADIQRRSRPRRTRSGNAGSSRRYAGARSTAWNTDSGR